MNGIYVLEIQIVKDTCITIGALGKMPFSKGVYVYIGSAQKNLEQRVKRHFRKEKRKFWHIDYLLEDEAANIVKVFYKKSDKNEECRLANQISKHGTPVVNFGCSDCHCKSHLFRLENTKFLQNLLQPLSIDFR